MERLQDTACVAQNSGARRATLSSEVGPTCVLILTQCFTKEAPQKELFAEPQAYTGDREAFKIMCVLAHMEVHVGVGRE